MSGMAPQFDETNPIDGTVDDRDADVGVTPRRSNGVHVETNQEVQSHSTRVAFGTSSPHGPRLDINFAVILA
jgi:hypothetical protein